MPNPAKVRVYYNEELNRTAEEAKDELPEAVGGINGVEQVEVERVLPGQAYQAVLLVSFDESVISSEELEYEISSLSFLHNAIVQN